MEKGKVFCRFLAVLQVIASFGIIKSSMKIVSNKSAIIRLLLLLVGITLTRVNRSGSDYFSECFWWKIAQFFLVFSVWVGSWKIDFLNTSHLSSQQKKVQSFFNFTKKKDTDTNTSCIQWRQIPFERHSQKEMLDSSKNFIK